MKKLVMSCTIFLFSLFVVQAQEAEANSFREVKSVNISTLAVKEAPDAAANTITYLDRNTFVTVFSTTDEWSHIKSGEYGGYVKSAYLQKPDSTIKIASSKGGLVVKESPSPTAKTLATLTYNMIVEDFGKVTDRYSFVQYGNITGYVVSTFMGVADTTSRFVDVNELAVRNIASPSGATITSLEKNAQVDVHSTLLGWAYITSGETRGYVEAKHLTVKEGYFTTDYFDFSGFQSLYYTSTSGTATYKIQNGSLVSTTGRAYTLRLENEKFILENFGEPELILPLPLESGARWKDGNESYTARSLGSYKVKGGTFTNVLEITLTAYGTATKYYFAPKIGLLQIKVDGYNFELTKVNR